MLGQLFGTGNKQDEIYALVVVENAPGEGQSLSNLLKEAGYDVRSTTCRAEGIDLLGQEPPPRGLIIDAPTIDMDAQEFVETARVRFGRTALPPVLLLAASEEGESLANLLEVDDYLPKPFEIDNLLQRVQQMVDNTIEE